jgi:hypothetical protein
MTAIAPSDWTSVDDAMPDHDGEFLCFVRVPRRGEFGQIVKPAECRYMALEHEKGVGFWIRNGLPKGMVTHWIELRQPQEASGVDAGAAGVERSRRGEAMIDVEALALRCGVENACVWSSGPDGLHRFAAAALEEAAKAAESPECGPDSTQRKITAQAIRALKPS